jgi:hypothetical protein
MTTKSAPALLAVLSVLLTLAACGDGGDSDSVAPVPPVTTPPTDAQRSAAATATANSNPACAEAVLGPFYWEIGDSAGVKVSGSVGTGVNATTEMAIASASKWVYSSYVVQKVGVRSADVEFLNFTSGYTDLVLPLCQPSETVASCLGDKGELDLSTQGKFLYSSGHMQVHATSTMGLGSMDNNALTAEVTSTLGDFGFQYVQPQLAGGLAASAAGYAGFLRKILRNELAIGAVLGTHKVCTNPQTCASALGSPIDAESWNYSLGHWVEDAPTIGDNAFSSAGALGFYPWIDSTKTYYGVLARRAETEANAGYNSAVCGRLIRQAWVNAVAVTARSPSL